MSFVSLFYFSSSSSFPFIFFFFSFSGQVAVFLLLGVPWLDATIPYLGHTLVIPHHTIPLPWSAAPLQCNTHRGTIHCATWSGTTLLNSVQTGRVQHCSTVCNAEQPGRVQHAIICNLLLPALEHLNQPLPSPIPPTPALAASR